MKLSSLIDHLKALLPKAIDFGPQFIQAAKISNTQIMTKCLNRGVGVNYQDPSNGWTALHYCVDKEDLHTIKYLTAKGASGAQRDRNGDTPMHMAVERRLQKIVAELIQSAKESGLNTTNKEGLTPLNLALRDEQEELADFLVSKKADLNKALFWANEVNHERQIDWLLSRGASPNFPDSKGMSPLVAAIAEQDYALVKKWLLRGADVNYAKASGQLLRCQGWSPLMFAIDIRNGEITSLLLSQPNVNLLHSAPTGIDAFALACETGHAKLAQIIAKQGINFSKLLPDGRTYLMIAASSGNLDLVRFVYEKDPPFINVQDKLGWSPLMYAIKGLAPDVVAFLLENGANRSVVSKQFKFDTLHVARRQKEKIPQDDLVGQEKIDQIISLLSQDHSAHSA